MTSPHPQPTATPARPAPPASARPLHELFQANQRGLSADGRHLVVPATVLERMPLGWQQQLAGLLRRLQHDHAAAPWPYYEVTPKLAATVAALSEAQLDEVGVLFELDDDGHDVYRWRTSGEPIASPETTQVLVTAPRDPMFPTSSH